MKNIIFPRRAKASKAWCIGTMVLISCFISACASNHSTNSLENTKPSNNHNTVSAEELEQHRDNLKKWLSGLEDGLSPEDTLKQVFSYLQYSFQIKKNGKLFQYFQGTYSKTEMEFGLLFEDGRLTNLLLGKAVNDFSWYRYDYARGWGHLFQYWLPNGLQEGVALIRQNNRLGDNYDDVISTYPKKVVKDSSGAAYASEAVITSLFLAPFLPIALVAMPFVPEDETAKESDKIDRSSYEQLRDLVSKVKLGMTTDQELMQLFGTPAYRSDTRLTYKTPNISFGITNGIVIWSESWRTQLD